MTPVDAPLVLETAAKYGVPGPVAQELMARTRPCLYLVPYEQLPASRRENARPAARTGGLPALPDGLDWPEPRNPLVLSVDCAALPHDVLDIELPADGHLLLFTEIEYPPESSVVLHVPAGARPADGRGAPEAAEAVRSDVRVAGYVFGGGVEQSWMRLLCRYTTSRRISLSAISSEAVSFPDVECSGVPARSRSAATRTAARSAAPSRGRRPITASSSASWDGAGSRGGPR
ncbi:hypothetical protein AB0I02_42975 [Streptomyces phaeochromogenes]